jgi:hypothetical protein
MKIEYHWIADDLIFISVLYFCSEGRLHFNGSQSGG